MDKENRALTRELVERLHGLGITVNCWTCDSKEKALMPCGISVFSLFLQKSQDIRLLRRARAARQADGRAKGHGRLQAGESQEKM